MTATECLLAARAIGIDIALDGDGLVLEASSPPPIAILDALFCNKAGMTAPMTIYCGSGQSAMAMPGCIHAAALAIMGIEKRSAHP